MSVNRRQIRVRWYSLVVIAAGLAACSDKPEIAEFSGPIMGTTFSVQIADAHGNQGLDALGEDILARLREIERTASTYDGGSALSRFNRSQNVEWITIDQTLCTLIQLASQMGNETNGAFDVTIGPLVNLWGFGPDEQRTTLPSQAEIDTALGRVGHQQLAVDCGQPAARKSRPDLYVDLSAIAKGYAVDEIARLVEQRGINDFLVEVGGELIAHGVKTDGEPWRVAIENPAGDGDRQVIPLKDRAMATSGDYQNFFEFDGKRYSHTIDPRTGRPVTHAATSVTTIHESAAVADALSTALLVMGPDAGLRFAEDRGLAARFLVRTETGIETRDTSAFRQLFAGESAAASFAYGIATLTFVSVRTEQGSKGWSSP